MALEFGFGRWDRNTPEKDQAWTKVWENLSETDQQFAWNFLPFMLMLTDVGIVTEKSIPHIVARIKIASPGMIAEAYSKFKIGDVKFEDYLKRFIGFSANVCTTTSAAFIKRMTDSMKRTLPSLTEKEIKEIKTPDVYTLINN